MKQDLKNFYKGTDLEKLEQPSKFNWSRFFHIGSIIFVLIIAIICLAYMSAYYELREDYDWAKKYPLEFIKTL